MKTPIRIAMLAMLTALTACGFHLRGEAHIAPALHTLHIDYADPNSPIKRDLENALRRSGVEIVAVARPELANLKLVTMQLVTEPLTVSRNARVKEYRVRFKVEILITDASGKTVLPQTTIELTRDYSFDETQALGAQAEEDLLKKELEREMVQQVLRRIERV